MSFHLFPRINLTAFRTDQDKDEKTKQERLKARKNLNAVIVGVLTSTLIMQMKFLAEEYFRSAEDQIQPELYWLAIGGLAVVLILDAALICYNYLR